MKEKVYEFVKTIPKGKVATYGQIAECLGNKNLARVVGNILHNNPDPANIPCHRVVNSNGKVSPAFAFGGGKVQRALLEKEGIVFEGNGKIDLKRYGIKERVKIMEKEYGEYITFNVTAKDGSEVEMALMDEFDFESKHYVVGAVIKDDVIQEEGLYIYRSIIEKDGFRVEKITREFEYKRVAEAYMEMEE